ncbi:glycosyltransferase family 4 protein [Derxia lacustris]|uniref:glycosyltransferase family 4 protein n=1 Tax=Derxia lacustris TaxID=764842 RepID=UPI000A16F70B|nr:glycosyltransferase family 1 protein [Derxia lacustris]
MNDKTTGRPRVFINGRFLAQRITGVQRFGRELLQAIDRCLAQDRAGDRQFHITVLAPEDAVLPQFASLEIETLAGNGSHRWEQLTLPRRVGSHLLVNPGFTGPVIKRNQIVTVHDGAVVRMPEGYSAQFRLWYRFAVGLIGRRAAATMAVSQFSAGEATECFGIPADRLHVCGEGWQHIQAVESDPSVLRDSALGHHEYFLVVSSPARHKNFAVVAAALESLGQRAPRCIAVGAADKRVFRGAGGNEAGIEHVGYVSDGQLKALYEHALGFIMPSFYEGFGIPPLEAMACGAAVIASTAPALREVCADAASYFDPESPAQLAAAITELQTDPARAAVLRNAARARLEHYSWDKAALCYLDLIARQLGRGRA